MLQENPRGASPDAKRSFANLFSVIKVCRLEILQKETRGASLSAKKVNENIMKGCRKKKLI